MSTASLKYSAVKDISEFVLILSWETCLAKRRFVERGPIAVNAVTACGGLYRQMALAFGQLAGYGRTAEVVLGYFVPNRLSGVPQTFGDD